MSVKAGQSPQGNSMYAAMFRGVQDYCHSGDSQPGTENEAPVTHGMPCHDHEEGDDARHDRHRPKQAKRTSMSMMTGLLVSEANNLADEHERRPEEAEH